MVAETKVSGTGFNANNLKKILVRENKFVENLLSILPIPTSALPDQNEDDSFKYPIKTNGQPEKTRARSLTELQERLKNVQSKKKLNYKDKLLKKGLKNRLKKKSKQEERNLKKKLVRMQKTKGLTDAVKNESIEEQESSVKTAKPVFNREGKMVFSKFDFSGLGSQKHEKNVEKDPKKILLNLEKQKAKIAELEKQGDKEKAMELKQKQAWKIALAKAEGAKVKDDPILLKKTIKKKEQQRKGSAKQWKAREDGVKKAQEIRQQKRTENLEKRKKEKKANKLKKAVKKGRIIPGY